MDLDPLRVIERLHGHAGWLGAALLVHPAVVLRDRRRRAHLAVALSTGAVTAIAALGTWLYVAYRERLKRQIFVEAPAAGWLFERKEHLAFGSVLLAWTGCAAYFAAAPSGRSGAADDATRAALRTAAHRAFVASAALALAVAALGTYVAVVRSF